MVWEQHIAARFQMHAAHALCSSTSPWFTTLQAVEGSSTVNCFAPHRRLASCHACCCESDGSTCRVPSNSWPKPDVIHFLLTIGDLIGLLHAMLEGSVRLHLHRKLVCLTSMLEWCARHSQVFRGHMIPRFAMQVVPERFALNQDVYACLVFRRLDLLRYHFADVVA